MNDITRNDFVGVWQSDHQNGLSRHRVGLHLQGMRLAGTWAFCGITPTGTVGSVHEVPLHEEFLRGDTLALAPAEQGGMMQIQLVSSTEIVLGPSLNAASPLDLTDPRVVRAIEMHQIKLYKQDVTEQQAAA
ncbi:MAG TPA: hypothetical protein VFZ34_33840 [Blastocatellia bacterium]|nr:hypothetical protein [Blastocatellia bacterium]